MFPVNMKGIQLSSLSSVNPHSFFFLFFFPLDLLCLGSSRLKYKLQCLKNQLLDNYQKNLHMTGLTRQVYHTIARMGSQEQDLHIAVRKGDTSSVEKLLSSGTNINCLFYGWTPLQLAVDIGKGQRSINMEVLPNGQGSGP